MDMSGVGLSFPPNPSRNNSKDSGGQIEELESKKSKLEQEIKEERNPFALTQSKAYEQKKKELEQVNQQLQQLKASSSNQTETAQQVEATNNHGGDNNLNGAKQFDEFICSKGQSEQPSAGIYSMTYDENGKPVASFTPYMSGENE